MAGHCGSFVSLRICQRRLCQGPWAEWRCRRERPESWARLDDDEELRLVKWIRDNTSLKAEYRNKELAKKELAMVRQSQKSLEALSSYWHPSRHTSTRSWQDARAAEEVFKFPGVPIPFSRGSLQDCITDCITRLWWRAYALKRTPYPSWTDGEQWVLWTLAHIIVHSRGRQKDAPNWPHIQELFTAARLQRTSEDLRQRYRTVLKKRQPSYLLDETALAIAQSPLSSLGSSHDLAFKKLRASRRQL